MSEVKFNFGAEFYDRLLELSTIMPDSGVEAYVAQLPHGRRDTVIGMTDSAREYVTQVVDGLFHSGYSLPAVFHLPGFTKLIETLTEEEAFAAIAELFDGYNNIVFHYTQVKRETVIVEALLKAAERKTPPLGEPAKLRFGKYRVPVRPHRVRCCVRGGLR